MCHWWEREEIPEEVLLMQAWCSPASPVADRIYLVHHRPLLAGVLAWILTKRIWNLPDAQNYLHKVALIGSAWFRASLSLSPCRNWRCELHQTTKPFLTHQARQQNLPAGSSRLSPFDWKSRGRSTKWIWLLCPPFSSGATISLKVEWSLKHAAVIYPSSHPIFFWLTEERTNQTWLNVIH